MLCCFLLTGVMGGGLGFRFKFGGQCVHEDAWVDECAD